MENSGVDTEYLKLLESLPPGDQETLKKGVGQFLAIAMDGVVGGEEVLEIIDTKVPGFSDLLRG